MSRLQETTRQPMHRSVHFVQGFWIIGGIVVVGWLAFSSGCQPNRQPSVVEGPQSPPGWEVRYNAAVALARRGSPRALDERVCETLLEMLDEHQQLRNFRQEVNGRSISDVNAAALTVVTTLQAIAELHRLQPDLDFSAFQPAIDKLLDSPNLVIRTEAKKTKHALTRGE